MCRSSSQHLTFVLDCEADQCRSPSECCSAQIQIGNIQRSGHLSGYEDIQQVTNKPVLQFENLIMIRLLDLQLAILRFDLCDSQIYGAIVLKRRRVCL